MTLGPGSHIQVLDPSILDLLNSAVRDVPQHALDIVLGAREFSQIAKVWRLANALDGTPIRLVLKDNSLKLVEKLREFVEMGSEPDDRERLIRSRIEIAKHFPLILEMADAMPSANLVDIVLVYFQVTTRNWELQSLNIGEGRELLDLFAECRSIPLIEVRGMRDAVWNAILRTIEEEGVWLAELIDIASMVENPSHALNVIRSAMARYEEDVFNDELSQCNSTNEFDDLEGLLEELRDFAQVEVEDMLNRTYDAREEFTAEQAEKGAFLMEEWKERKFDQDENARASFSDDETIRALFDSLR